MMSKMMDKSNPNYGYVIARVGDIRLTPEQFEKLHSIRDYSRLEKELKKISSFGRAKFIHYGDVGGCGLKSVVRIGSDPQDEDVYFCIYCDRDFQMDQWDFRYSGIRPAI
jgi:hypothetical protein